ncbi:MAG TPA: helix-turn-helix domain-containing protein [Solirubrobacteraceae bacterium]|nr:helix-turn-helix domain-containing protein [Solirubrobacteraceae bacterium]
MDDRISITLSRKQINDVLQQATREDGIAGTLSGLHDREKLAGVLSCGSPYLSRSLLLGLVVLRCFPEDGSTLGVTEVSGLLDLNPSTVFRYLATLVLTGVLERDAATRRYRRPTEQPTRPANVDGRPEERARA